MKTLLTLLALVAGSIMLQARDTRFVIDFGAIPDDGQDDTDALRAAAQYCRQHPGTTLVFAPGTYILRDKEALRVQHEAMSGAYGQDPEKRMFLPYHQYVSGLDFTGAQDITVEAAGATLMCDGWMEVITLSQTRHFTLSGLTIDHLRHPMSEGVVTQVDEGSFVVHFTRPAVDSLTFDTPYPRVVLWDLQNDGAYSSPFYFARQEMVGHNMVRFRGQLPQRMVGAPVSVPHSFHYRPAIFVHESEDTHLSHVTIHAHCGMGIVGFHTRDVTMDYLSVCPTSGYHFSTNTDATHFAACEGRISFDHCFFYGQGDDATNVHGYYHDIDGVQDGWATLHLRAGTFTHCQLADVPRVGDKMALVRISTLEPVREYTVRQVRHQPKSVTFDVRLNAQLPDSIQDYYLINTTLMPSLVFRNSVDYGHIARSVLVKTHNVLIENNIFRGVSMTPVILCSESGWKEGWHTENAIIRGNHFDHCNVTSYCQGASIGVRLEAPDNASVQLHRNILIEDNTFRGMGDTECAISVENAQHVTLRNNRAEGYRQLLHTRAAVVKEK